MAYESHDHVLGYEAEVDMSAKQFHFVKNGTTGEQVGLAVVGEKSIGVVINKPQAGQNADVVHSGVVKVVAAVNLAKGDRVSPDANSQARVTTTNDYPAGEVQEAGNAGEVVPVLLIKSLNPSA